MLKIKKYPYKTPKNKFSRSVTKVFTKEQIDLIIKKRKELHRNYDWDDYSLCICDLISRYIHSNFGIKGKRGLLKTSKGDIGHCFNVMKDGTIIDASSDQFGFNGITIVGPKNPKFKHYKIEETLR